MAFQYSFTQFLEARKSMKSGWKIQSLEDFMKSELHESKKMSLPVLIAPVHDDDVMSSPSATLAGRSMLGASTRALPPEEMQKYLGNIKDKDLPVAQKYKMPYVHGSNIAANSPKIVGESGQEYNLDALKAMIVRRPTKLLKRNEKIEHSGGGATQFYNLGLPALKGLAVDEQSGDFIVVDTCPGAGACKVYCYARKGGYIQWKNSSMSQTRILNFLLNDPSGFQSMLTAELTKAHRSAIKGDYDVALRWHDAGDFFSEDYWGIAKSVAETLPAIKFYAYTKMGDIATGDKPDNFVFNFSGGATSDQEKKVDFRTTKNSRVVPRDVFRDFVEREGGGRKGRLMYTDLDGLKAVLAKKYGVTKKSIISYQELQHVKKSEKPHWNVIVKPGDGDDSAYRKDVIGTYLLEH